MKLYLRPKGENDLPLHPTANVEECMKSYDKVIGELYTEEEVYFILCEHTAELFKGSELTLSDWFKKYKK